jgi:hypothetical protein
LSKLTEIIETLHEVERLHQLDLELLEQLNVISCWLVENDIPIPNPHILYSLLAKAKALLTEIQSDEPKMLQYQKLVDEKKQHFKTDEDEPVPANLKDKYPLCISFHWESPCLKCSNSPQKTSKAGLNVRQDPSSSPSTRELRN